MSFLLKKKLKLGFLGSEWKDCYIEFSSLTIGELKRFTGVVRNLNDPEELKGIMDDCLKLLSEKLIGGKGIGEDGKPVDITVENFRELPSSVLNSAVVFLMEDKPKKV